MVDTLTIGQVARATGLSAKTIRYYEEVGLLPTPRRTAAGYRQYEASAVERLNFVRRARALGLPLRRLRALRATFDDGSRAGLRPHLLAMVREQLGAVQRRIAELEALRHQLEAVSRTMRASGRPDRTGACRCLQTDGEPPAERTPRRRRRS